MEPYRHGEPIFKTGKIQVTPIMTDHSAMDAYMFLVEVEGKKILFTGDFRDHGIASENNRFWEKLEETVPENKNRNHETEKPYCYAGDGRIDGTAGR